MNKTNTITGQLTEVINYGLYQRITLGEQVRFLVPIDLARPEQIGSEQIGQTLTLHYHHTEVFESPQHGNARKYLIIKPIKISRSLEATYPPVVRITGLSTAVEKLSGPGVVLTVGGVRVATLPVKQLGIILTEVDVFLTNLKEDTAKDLYVVRPNPGNIFKRLGRWLKELFR